jgi:putative endopeptidase
MTARIPMWLLRASLIGLAMSSSVGAADHASIGDYGFDIAGMDRAAKPGEDFNEYANGAWMKRAAIPGDHASWGVWDVLQDIAEAQVRQILEDAAQANDGSGTNARKIGDFYASFMDEAAIETRGARPLEDQLAAIATIRNYHQLAAAMGHAIRVGDSMPIGFSVFADLKRPDINLGYLTQGGLGLPDRDYYLSKDPKMAEARAAYVAYATKLLRLAGVASTQADAVARVEAVFEVEGRLAKVQWTRVQLRDIPAQYNPWARSDYGTHAPGLDWDAYFKAAGIADQPVVVSTAASAITASAAIVSKIPLPVWRDYMTIRAIDQHASHLSKAFVDARFEFHDTALRGTPDQQVRWKRGTQFTEQALGEAVGQIYVQRHFSPEARASAKQLVANLLAATRQRIDALDWMSPETKAKAREKLSAFSSKIGYPDTWRNYSKLTIVRGDAYGNVLAADRFEYDRNLAKLGKPVDRSEWAMTPMTINAYYDPTLNDITFPAAVLQPPFFDPNADPAVNYGGIGAIIGHEISHGFDDQGRLFDARGALKDWWTPNDAVKYKKRTDALVAQYSAYEVLPGLKLNGELTLGENIADNAGIVVAYDAYHASLGGKPAPIIDGQTGDQRFFLGFAQNWRTLWREAIQRQLTTTDPHSPDAIRVRTVRNFDAWYLAYEVRPGDKLYLTPEDRVRIW